MLKEISETIKYLPSSEKPLSAEVFVLEKDDRTVIFDVGSNEDALQLLNSIEKPRSIVLSHFHEDHFGNVKRLILRPEDVVYGGDFTCKKLSGAQRVDSNITIADGIEVFSLPSTHAKGCVGMLAEGYAFLGDGTYGTAKDGRHVYNTSLLHETIATLEKLPATKFVLSHRLPDIFTKDEIIEELKAIYSKRTSGEAYIHLS